MCWITLYELLVKEALVAHKTTQVFEILLLAIRI